VRSAFVYSHLAADPALSKLVDLFVQELPNRSTPSKPRPRTGLERIDRTAHQIKGRLAAMVSARSRLTLLDWKPSRERPAGEQILAALGELLSSAAAFALARSEPTRPFCMPLAASFPGYRARD